MVIEHVNAFNAHDSGLLLSGFAATAIWATGRETFRTTEELATLFDPSLWELKPSLSIRSLIVDGCNVAAELQEELTVDGVPRTFDIAVFFTVQDGLIEWAKVYREGSADIDRRDCSPSR